MTLTFVIVKVCDFMLGTEWDFIDDTDYYYVGGPGQMPHLAPTYAAVLALCTLGTHEAYNIIDRPGLQRFLLKMHQQDGSYIMHEDGETDIRLVCFSVGLSMFQTECRPLDGIYT